ncbi:MAG: DUF881 domain-containing protein [Frankiales bacterium]|nr:DUF881 domain-containing protein [Frankiales bacterium]
MTTPQPAGVDSRDAWRRIRRVLTARPGGRQTGVAVLCGVLAFALVTQVHSTSAAGGGLASARPDDLLGISSDLAARADRLRAEIAALEASARRLSSATDQGAAALREVRARARALGILTGTVAARGPGIVLTITDPRASVSADLLLSAVEELRDAGAEVLQLNGVRIVAQTAFLPGPGGAVEVGGTVVSAPYRLAAIGQPRTLAGALGIPGGVLDAVAGRPGARAVVTQSPSLSVTALRAPQADRYARPAR